MHLIKMNDHHQELEDTVIIDMILEEVTRDAGFKALMVKYQEKLYWHIRRMVHHHEDADDVIQNTFIKVYRNISNFKKESQLFTWLYRIATNESITFLKQKKKRDGQDGMDNELSIQHLKADEYFDGDEAQELLALAMNQLPDKQKVVFNLRYYEEMSYADMSEVLETSIGALKASYHHAVKKIENYLKNAIR
jgi:RNA polymerase sigma-70 factor (ECF subfamily)